MFLGSIVLLWNKAVGWTDLAIFVFMYAITGFGITIGYHRLFTHRAFETSTPVRVALAIAGSMAVEGDVITWVADHRKHHAFADEEGDPHSPHVDFEDGFRGAVKGLWHAHVGWMLGDKTHGRASARRYAPDLIDDKPIRWVSRTFLFWVGMTLFLPFLLGFVLSGFSLVGGAARARVGRLRADLPAAPHDVVDQLRLPLLRRAAASTTEDESRNVFWLALPSLGEAWHHNHHAFPTLRLPRPAAAGAAGRPERARDRGDGEARARLERRAREPGAPGKQGARQRVTSPADRRLR